MKHSIMCVSFTLALAALPALAAELPAEVIAEIIRLEAECDGKPPLKTDLNTVQKADINGDGVTDYVISDGQVDCAIGASFRHGNGGTGVIIFAGTATGAVKAYDDTVFDVKVENGKAWVGVGGHRCGQGEFKSRADAISCDLPLLWNAAKQKFEEAPVSQARFTN